MSLLQVNGRVSVPPVFYADFAAFYCTDYDAATTAREGWIRIYKYSTQMYQLELAYEHKVLAAEPTGARTGYAWYSLVKVGADGFIFKGPAAATIYRYAWTTAVPPVYSFTATTTLVAGYADSCTATVLDAATGLPAVTADGAACVAHSTKAACIAQITAAAFAVSGTTKACTWTAALSAGATAGGGATATANLAAFVMQQVSEDPVSYNLATIPGIYGWMSEEGDGGAGTWSPSFFKVNWTGAGTNTLQAADVVAVPPKYRVQLQPQLVSFGRRYVAIMSPIQCAATAPVGSLADQH